MKIEHQFLNLDYVPVVKDLNNIEIDEFIVYEDETVQKTNKDIISFICEDRNLNPTIGIWLLNR